MKYFSSNSSSCFINSDNSEVDIIYGDVEISPVPGIKSIENSFSQLGRKPRISLRKTSIKF